MATTKSTKRHTSKAERQQARERAQERAQAALDRLGREPTAWDVMQRFTREKFHEIARQGERAAFEDWLAGSSFAEIYTDDIRATVRGWLDETDEEAARYGDEETIKLYRNLLDREISRMAQEQKPRQGYRVELHPWVSEKTRKVLATMDLYRDDRLLASVAGLDPYPAFWTQDWIEDAVKRTGDLPLYLSDATLDLDDPRHDAPGIAVDATLRAAFQRADRIAEFATYAAPALHQLDLLGKQFLVDGMIGEEDYYPAVDGIYGQIAAYEAEGRFPNLLVSEIDVAHQRLWDGIKALAADEAPISQKAMLDAFSSASRQEGAKGAPNRRLVRPPSISM